MRNLAVLLFTVLLPSTAAAGTVTIVDLSDTISLADDTGRASILCDANEHCVLTLLAPAPAITSIGIAFINSSWRWVEPGTLDVSDLFTEISTSPLSDFVTVGFSSDVDGIPLDPGGCPTIGFCPEEDGTPQAWATITWNGPNIPGGVIDTINMQSDPTEAPEPSTLLLSAAALAATWTFRNRLRPIASRSA